MDTMLIGTYHTWLLWRCNRKDPVLQQYVHVTPQTWYTYFSNFAPVLLRMSRRRFFQACEPHCRSRCRYRDVCTQSDWNLWCRLAKGRDRLHPPNHLCKRRRCLIFGSYCKQKEILHIQITSLLRYPKIKIIWHSLVREVQTRVVYTIHNRNKIGPLYKANRLKCTHNNKCYEMSQFKVCSMLYLPRAEWFQWPQK